MLDSVSFNLTLTQWIPTIGSLLSVLLSLPALQLVQTCSRKKLFINTLVLCAASTLLMALFSILSPVLEGYLQFFDLNF